MTPAQQMDEIHAMRRAGQQDLDRGDLDRHHTNDIATYLDDTGFLLDRLAAVEAERDRAIGQAATLVAELGEPSDRLRKLEAVADDAGLFVWWCKQTGVTFPARPATALAHLSDALAALDEAGADR